MPHFFYLARCADESLYAGTCVDLDARLEKHNAGTGAKYTRSRRPVRRVRASFDPTGRSPWALRLSDGVDEYARYNSPNYPAAPTAVKFRRPDPL